MLKKLPLLALLLLIFQIGIAQEDIVPIPQKSPLEKIETHVGIIDVSVEYSRPSVRNRKIFGELVPYDKIWRTGANVNTRITFSGPVVVGDQELEAGVYSLFTKPNPNEWEVYFHTEYNKYGEPDTMHLEDIMAKITVPVKNQERAIETFSINFENIRANGCSMVLSWDQVLIEIPITIPTSSIMESTLDKTLEQTANAYAYAAWNYFDMEMDSKSALKAIDFALSLREKDISFEEWLTLVDPQDWGAPWYYQIKSEIHADLGDYKEAIAAAERSLEVCTKIESAKFYIKKNLENIEKWGK